MKKTVLLLLIIVNITIIYGQNNDYFGSVIIPKNQYIISPATTPLFWDTPAENKSINATKITDLQKHKIMFIPAGKGFYYIKFLLNGMYLTCVDNNKLVVQTPVLSEQQKFKVINTGNNLFQILNTENKMVVYKKDGNLVISNSQESNHHKFEILEAESRKHLTGNE